MVYFLLMMVMYLVGIVLLLGLFIMVMGVIIFLLGLVVCKRNLFLVSVYVMNIVGAVLGCLFIVFWLILVLGIYLII